MGVRVRLLGGLAIDGVDLAALGSAKARLLVRRLAVERGRPVSIDALVDLIWPAGGAPARPADQLSVLVSRSRAVLGADAIIRTDAGYALAVDWLDLDAIGALIDEAGTRLAEGRHSAASAAADAALTLVRGRLLPEDADAEWLAADRATVDRLTGRALVVGAEAAIAAGRHGDAIDVARRALEHDPYDEVALRALMTACAASGRPAVGLSTYAHVAATLREELGVDPQPDTQALHLALLRASNATAIDAPVPVRGYLSGRAEELASLQASFERALAGTAHAVSIEGEPGIGKTRLLDAVVDVVGDRADVLLSSGSRAGALPLGPVLDAVRQRLTRADDEERRAMLGADADLLAPLLGLSDYDTATTYADVLLTKEPGAVAPSVLHIAVLNVVSRLAATRPVLLAIDDAHHVDAATGAWIDLVLHRRDGLRLFVLLAQRSGERAALPEVERLHLGRLDRDAAAEVLGREVLGDQVDEQRIDELYERSGGHPLFLVELAHATGDVLPESIRQAVVARIVDAEPAASTLRTAAVLDANVDVELLSSLLQRAVPDLLDDLELGLRRNVLADASRGFVFRHDIVREALAADVPSARRAWLHRETARVLSNRPNADPLAMARHAQLGGDRRVAAQALRQAAAVAADRYDHAEALRLTDESLSLDDCAEGHIARSRHLLFLGRYDEARREADLALSRDGDVAALEIAAYAAYYARDWAETVALADEAAKRHADPQTRLSCQFLAAKALHTTGALNAAEQRFQAAVEAAPGSALRPLVVVWFGLLHLHRGDVDAALACLAERTLARQAPFPFADIYCDQIAAHAEVMAGRPCNALSIADRMAASVAEQQATRFSGRAEVYRGWALSMVCAPEAGEALLAAREVAHRSNVPEPHGQGTLDLAALRLTEGRYDEVGQLLDEVAALLDAAPVSNGWRIDLRRRYLAARLAVGVGDFETGQGHAADVTERAGREGIRRYVALAESVALEARLTQGDSVDADSLAAVATTLHNVARPEAWRVTARLAMLSGNDRLRDLARAYADERRRAAGDYRDVFGQTAARLID